METPIMTFKAYEWIKAFIEVGIMLFLGAIIALLFIYYQVWPAYEAELTYRERQAEIRAMYQSRNGCNWVERDGMLICKAKKGIK